MSDFSCPVNLSPGSAIYSSRQVPLMLIGAPANNIMPKRKAPAAPKPAPDNRAVNACVNVNTALTTVFNQLWPTLNNIKEFGQH